MNVLLSDITNQTNDLLSNYNVTTVDAGNTQRAINRAIEYVQRRLGLPSDKQIFSFYYYEDTIFYNIPNDGFNELIQISYNNLQTLSTNIVPNVYGNPNVPKNRWFVDKDIELIRNTGWKSSQNKCAYTTMNQFPQIMMVGQNLNGSYTVNSFDSTVGLTFSTDITNVSIDPYVVKQGSGSLKFNMNNTHSASTITIAGNWDISQLLSIASAYRMYIDFPIGASTQISSINISFVSSVGNSYNVTTSTQDSGAAWTENVWNRISWFLSNETTTGTPLATQISSIVITFNHSGTFTGITNMRIDNLYQISPDYMDCLFYSAYKGTDSTGTIPKIILDDDSDIASFGTYAPDLIYPISLKAATILNPQLRADLNFAQMYQADFKDALTLMSRTYPRIRQAPSAQTQLIRS
jgi:hypothetical protein